MLLKFAFQDFLEDRKFKNTSEANLQNYKILLGEFVQYCIENEILNVNDITYSNLRDYLMCCQKKGNGAGTINTKLQRIRAFFNYLVEEEIIKNNPAKKIKRLKEDVKIDVFSDEQIKQMLNFYRRMRRREDDFFAYRDYILIIVLLGTGIRRSEVINLKWSDVDFTHLNLSIVGKSRKKESIPITDKLAKELMAYQTFCRQRFKKLSEYVFTNRKNKQMTQNNIHMIFRYLREQMDFKDVRVSAHTFRHTFCHRLAMSGMSAFAIQKLMRHQNINVTMRYVAMWGTELREQNDKHNPLNLLDI